MGDPEPIKVVLLGETGVGKTSIISQFTTHTFDPHRETSLSAQFISKTVYFQDIGQSIKFDIWDTVGQEKYRSLAKIFYKDAKVIIFVYDITRPETFEGLKNYWYDETKNNTDGEPILAVVANKIDLYANSKVSNNDGKAFADQIGAIFQTTSALSDSGISTLFDNVGKKYLIPGYDYQSEDKQAQEQFLKKKKENEGKNKPGRNKKVNENKGLRLEQNENKQKSKKGWC
jgi:small GTP-binding protein